MRKIVVKYFVDFLEGQENWLNEMANKGWKLVNTSRLLYEFERCNPGEYVYKVEFIAHMSNSERKEYISLIEEYGDNVFVKNINLNYSVGKMRWRPWANMAAQVSTSPGSYNKELLIVERKNNSKPFEMHTDLEDLIKYIKPIRNSHLFTVALLVVLIAYKFSIYSTNIFSIIIFILLSILTIILLIKTFKYSKMLSNYKKQFKIHE